MQKKITSPKTTYAFRLNAMALCLSCASLLSLPSAYAQPVETGAEGLMNNQKFELTQSDLDFIDKNNAIQNNPKDILGDDLSWLDKAMAANPEADRKAQELINAINPPSPSGQASQAEEKPESLLLSGQYEQFVFITYALGDMVLQEVLEHAAHNPNVLVVMRGVPDGMTFYEGILRIQQMASSFDPMPNIVIDPELFKRFDVKVAPTVVHAELIANDAVENTLHSLGNIQGIDDLEGQQIEDLNNVTALLAHEQLNEIARVEGLTDTIYLTEQIKDGKTGDLGQLGTVVAIAEPDLIEVMKQQAAGIDWEAKKEGAIKRVWYNQQFHYLANAPRERIRLIDPTIVMQQDIQAKNGDYIIRKGDRINPFDIKPMDFALVIFNPLEKKQIPIAKAHGERLKKLEGVKQVMYLATEIDREEGWDFYNELSDTLDEHIYLLTQDVKERFNVQYVPTLVQGFEKQFMVTELYVQNEPESDNTANLAVNPAVNSAVDVDTDINAEPDSEPVISSNP